MRCCPKRRLAPNRAAADREPGGQDRIQGFLAGYRLAPEHPSPAGADDTVNALPATRRSSDPQQARHRQAGAARLWPAPGTPKNVTSPARHSNGIPAARPAPGRPGREGGAGGGCGRFQVAGDEGLVWLQAGLPPAAVEVTSGPISRKWASSSATGAVLDAARHDQQVAGGQGTSPSRSCTVSPPQQQEGLVLVVVAVPVRRSGALGHLEQVAVGRWRAPAGTRTR